MAKRPKPKRKQSAAQLANLAPQFKKGQVNNPLGAGAHNKEMKALKHMASSDFVEVGSFILEQNYLALKEIIEDGSKNKESKVSAFRHWLASVAKKGIDTGDYYALDNLLDRLIGKVEPKTKPDNFTALQVNLNQNPDKPPQVVLFLPDNNRQQRDVTPGATSTTPTPAPATGTGEG